MKSRRILMAIMAILLIVFVVAVFRIAYPTARNIAEQSVDYFLSAEKLTHEMTNAENAIKYGDKVIQTFGTISDIEGSIITLEETVIVHLMDNLGSTIKKGDTITIKGRCIGYDELFGEVKLDQASIIKAK